VAVPPATAETTPVVEPTVATAVLPELQVPPVVASLKVVVDCGQTFKDPVMEAGAPFTVICDVTKQPAGMVYVITATPVVTPETLPVKEPTEAVPEALLVHEPPDVRSLKVVELPVQTLLAPVILLVALTVTGSVVIQVLGPV